MRQSQQLKMELERKREKRTAFASTVTDFSAMDAEQRKAALQKRSTELSTLNADIEDCLNRYEAAVANEADSVDSGVVVPTADVDKSNKELVKLRSRVSFQNFLRHSRTRTELQGAEREYANALLGPGLNAITNDDGGPSIPPEFFVYTAEEHRELKEREFTALTNTSADTADENRNAVLRRLFHRSVADFLRVEFMAAPPGAQSFPVFSAGADPTTAMVTIARKSPVAEATTTVTASTVTPQRFGAQYKLYAEDEALLAGATGLHQDDITRALRDALDRKAVALLSGVLTAAADTSQATTRGNFLQLGYDFIDGLYAEDIGDVSLLVPKDAYIYAASLRNSTTDETALQVMRREGVTIRSTAKLTVDGTSKKGDLIVVRRNGESPVAPIWGGVNLVTDRVTGVAKGEIAVTAYMMANLHVRRTGVFALHKIQTT